MYHIRNFLEWSKIRGLSKSTIKHREQHLNKLVQFLNKKDIFNIKKVTKIDLNEYIQFLFHEICPVINKVRKYQSTMLYIHTVKQYFKYLYNNSYIIYNPIEKLELPKIKKNLPKGILSEKEILKILSIPDIKDYQGYLDKMIIEILYSTGIRINELVNLNIYDIDLDDKTLRIIEGKGKKDRLVPIGNTALKMIKEYLLKRPDKSKYTNLLITEMGIPVKTDNIYRKIKYYAKKAGIKKNITTHSIRHSFAVHLLKNGADLFSIKEMLGHKSIETTQIYLRVYNEDLKNMHNKSHPRKKLRIKEKTGGKK